VEKLLPKRLRRKHRTRKAKEAKSVNDATEKKIVKEIKVDLDKCIGCRACEVACSAFHAKPRYSSTNPARSRIRVVFDELNDVYVPIRAGDYTPAECTGRHTYTINGKEYRECSFCGVSCPCRDYFKEPDSGLPLKCDMCETVPPVEEPMCVQVCRVDALTYVEREEEADEEEKEEKEQGKLDIGLESLVNEYGLQKIMETVARMSKKGQNTK
jgi:benzoyl-CoA reductase subunit BamC